MFLCHLKNPLESVTNGSVIDAFPEAAYLLKNINVHLELNVSYMYEYWCRPALIQERGLSSYG